MRPKCTNADLSYTLLLIEDMLKTQFPGRIFLLTDLTRGYQQMALAHEFCASTDTSTRIGPLQWKVISVAVTDGNAASQCMLENMLELVRDCADPFTDDLTIASGDSSMSYNELLQAHKEDVTRVLDLLFWHKLKGSSGAATIAVSELVFAGQVDATGQLKPILGKVALMEHWEKPKTVSEVRAYLGFCNYYSRYITIYAGNAAPMTTMLKGNGGGPRRGPRRLWSAMRTPTVPLRE